MKTQTNKAEGRDGLWTKDGIVTPLLMMLGMIVLAYFSGPSRLSLGAGVKVSVPPFQESLGFSSSFEEGDYRVTPLANFSCSAKLIGKKKYSDHWSDICPVDFTLGWQELSDESIIEQIDFSQRNRWTFYKYSQNFTALDGRQIIEMMTNAHMCPANEEVRNQLLKVPVGCIIKFSGKLIGLKNLKSGWYSTSSTSRKDTGDGACEIIWVEHFTIVDK